jgi:hypothetical protein
VIETNIYRWLLTKINREIVSKILNFIKSKNKTQPPFPPHAGLSRADSRKKIQSAHAQIQ